MAIFKESGITFSKVPNVGLKLPSGPILRNGVYSELNGELKRNSNVFTVNAIDIDWNGCKVNSSTILNTTSDLINWIKGGSATPTIKYTDNYSNGIVVGELKIGDTVVTIHAPNSDGSGRGTSIVDNKDEIDEQEASRLDSLDYWQETEISSNAILVKLNINTSEYLEIKFIWATSISIFANLKIKLFKITNAGEELISIKGLSTSGNILKILSPETAYTRYKVKVEEGAIKLTTSSKTNLNSTAIEFGFSVSSNINNDIKYLIIGLFNFNDPTTLSPIPNIPSQVTSGKSVGNTEFKIDNGNIGLKFDNSDAIIGGTLNGMPDIVKDTYGYHLEIRSQVRAKFIAYNNCKIKAIHFYNDIIYCPVLWKVTDTNDLATYYGQYTEGYATNMDSDHVNPNWGHLSPFDYGGNLHDDFKFTSWYFNNGAKEVVMQHMNPKNGDWRHVYVEYEESNRIPTSKDYITYYKEFSVDFRSKSIGSFSNEISSDNCINISNMSSLSGSYPLIKKSGSNNYLEITNSTPISISSLRPNSKCLFPTEILSIEPLYNSLVSNIECMKNIAGGVYGGTDIDPWTYNGNMNVTYKGNEGFTHLEFKGAGKIYGIKVKYRTTYSANELIKTIYEHPIQYSDNPTNGMQYTLINKYNLYSDIFGSTNYANNEHLLNDIVIYAKDNNYNPIDLIINTDLENIIWFFDYNKEGYSTDYVSTTPIYTKLGKFIEGPKIDGKKTVKIQWIKGNNMEAEFYDGLLEEWYSLWDSVASFCIVLPRGLICDSNKQYGNNGYHKENGLWYGSVFAYINVGQRTS